MIETLEPAGLGALMALVEERKKKLAAEGLFDEARKQLLPFLPAVIGVITSPTGAVIRDILHRLCDRFPRHVIVWGVRVQGEGSALEVAAAIRGFNAIIAGGRIAQPDLLIVARGGGSLEDLWSFNEEIVVRAAAESMIPLISAVGHETDVTLIDFASDKRAPTPTAAAEMAVPVRSDLLLQVDSCARRALACWQRSQERRHTELRAATRALPDAEDCWRCRASGWTMPRAAPTRANRQCANSPCAILPNRFAARPAGLAARTAAAASSSPHWRIGAAAPKQWRGNGAESDSRLQAAATKWRAGQCGSSSSADPARARPHAGLVARSDRAMYALLDRRTTHSSVTAACSPLYPIAVCWRAVSRWCANRRTSASHGRGGE